MSLCGRVSGLKLGFIWNTFCVKQVQKHYISISQICCHVENFHMVQLFHRSVKIHAILTLKVISGLFCPKQGYFNFYKQRKREGLFFGQGGSSLCVCFFSDIRAQKIIFPWVVTLTSPSLPYCPQSLLSQALNFPVLPAKKLFQMSSVLRLPFHIVPFQVLCCFKSPSSHIKATHLPAHLSLLRFTSSLTIISS